MTAPRTTEECTIKWIMAMSAPEERPDTLW